MLPNKTRKIELVMKTETAAQPQLNKTVRGLRLNLSDEKAASVEATSMAAGPP
jgi:hypothetical protein